MKVISDITGKDSCCLLNCLYMSEMTSSQRTKEMGCLLIIVINKDLGQVFLHFSFLFFDCIIDACLQPGETRINFSSLLTF